MSLKDEKRKGKGKEIGFWDKHLSKNFNQQDFFSHSEMAKLYKYFMDLEAISQLLV